MSRKKIKSNGGDGKPMQFPPAEIQISQDDLMGLRNAHCPKCDGRLFLPCFWFKKLPFVHPGNTTSQNKLIPVSLHYCLKCGQEFGPAEVNGCFE